LQRFVDGVNSRAERWSVVAFAVGIAVFAFAIGLLSDRPYSIDVDELGLRNPIYMYLHYGQMTGPVYYQFTHMTTHPPTAYLMVAWLMQLGIPLFYAEAIPVLALLTLALALIAQGRFPTHIKLGLMFGAFTGGMIAHTDYFELRADNDLAMTWFTGLVALENARLDGWNTKKLFLGSFLLTLASGLHYFGFIAFVGVVVYMIWVYRALGFAAAKGKILAMIAGGCLFGVPFLLLFIIPNWPHIVANIQAASGNSTLADGVQLYFAQYDSLLKQADWTHTFGGVLAFPLLYFHVPLCIVALLLLFRIPATRGIALGGAPLVLLVFLSAHKQEHYLVPEFMLYFSGILISLLAQVVKVIARFPTLHRSKFGVPAAIGVLSVGVFLSVPSSLVTHVSLEPHFDEMDIARAAAREVLGTEALVGGRSGLWYISGAAHWYDISRDLVWNANPIVDGDLRSYFTWFDAMAEYVHMSDVTVNQLNKSLSSWYVDGTLQLRGFYFGQNHPHMSYLLFSVDQAAPLIGYGLREDHLYRLEEVDTGDYVLATMVCAIGMLNESTFMPEFSSVLYLPGDTPTVDFLPTNVEQIVWTMVVSRDDYAGLMAQEFEGCDVRDEFSMAMTPVDRAAILDNLAQNEQTIRIYQTFQEAVLGARNVVVSDDGQLLFDLALRDPEPVYTAGDFTTGWDLAVAETRVINDAATGDIEIMTNDSNYDWQLVSQPIPVRADSAYLLEFDLGIDTGGASVTVMGADRQTMVTGLNRCEPEPEAPRTIAFNSGDNQAISIAISNCRVEAGVSVIQVGDVTLSQMSTAQ